MSKIKFSDIGIVTVPVVLFFIIMVLTKNAVIDDISLRSVIIFMVAVPIVEEYLFRGVFQQLVFNKIQSKILGITYANILTSIIFSLSHIFSTPILSSILIFIPSIIFGVLYDRSKSIYPSIIVHSIYNFNIFMIYNKNIFS